MSLAVEELGLGQGCGGRGGVAGGWTQGYFCTIIQNTGKEGQADRTVISLQGAKTKILMVSLGPEKLA